MSALLLALCGAALLSLGMVLSVSAAVRAGDRVPCTVDVLAAIVAYALASLAFLPIGA